jgi:hypothetical protein
MLGIKVGTLNRMLVAVVISPVAVGMSIPNNAQQQQQDKQDKQKQEKQQKQLVSCPSPRK